MSYEQKARAAAASLAGVNLTPCPLCKGVTHHTESCQGVDRVEPAVKATPLTIEQVKRAHVEQVVRELGNKTTAARALGIDRRTLYRLLESYRTKP